MFIFRTNIELWELDSFENQIINRTLPNSYNSLGLFLVDIGYCSKDREEWKNEYKLDKGILSYDYGVPIKWNDINNDFFINLYIKRL